MHIYVYSAFCCSISLKDTAELFFDNVRLPESALLGNENAGFYALMSELGQERILTAIMGIAAAEAMFEVTRSYVKERKAFGKTVAAFQV
jgi:long-chain-acyl-CoA dehydrogenase